MKNDGELDLTGDSDLLQGDQKQEECTHWWYSPTEAKLFADRNEHAAHSNERMKMTYRGQSLYTACTKTPKPPERFGDYVEVIPAEGAEYRLGESWSHENLPNT